MRFSPAAFSTRATLVHRPLVVFGEVFLAGLAPFGVAKGASADIWENLSVEKPERRL